VDILNDSEIEETLRKACIVVFGFFFTISYPGVLVRHINETHEAQKLL